MTAFSVGGPAIFVQVFGPFWAYLRFSHTITSSWLYFDFSQGPTVEVRAEMAKALDNFSVEAMSVQGSWAYKCQFAAELAQLQKEKKDDEEDNETENLGGGAGEELEGEGGEEEDVFDDDDVLEEDEEDEEVQENPKKRPAASLTRPKTFKIISSTKKFRR